MTTALRAPRVACPQCGAPVPLGADDVFVSCTSCRAALYADVGRAVPHVGLSARLGSVEARGALDRFLRAAEVDAPQRVVAARLLTHPWWQVGSGEGAVLIPAADETALLDPPRRAQAAAELGPWQPAPSAEDLVPTVPAPELWVQDGPAPPLRLVRVPVWRIEYEVGGRRYVAHVSAVEGQVSALVLPPSSSRRMDRTAIAQLATVTLAFALVAAFVPGFFATVLAFAALGAVILFVVRRQERGG